MTVAILLPVYNEKKEFFLECLQSIQEQTYVDFHCYILDDGSDGYIKDLSNSFLEDARFKYFRFEHRGLVNTLNSGLSILRDVCFNNFSYEMVSRMDSDDVMVSDRLEVQLNVFKEYSNINIVGSSVIPFYDLLNVDIPVTDKYEIMFNSREVYNSLLTNCVLNHPTISFRGSILEDVVYPDKLLFEDLSLWQCLVTVDNSLVMRYPVTLYRQKYRKFPSFKEILNSKINWVSKNNINTLISVVDSLNDVPLGIEKTISYRSRYLKELTTFNLTIIREPVLKPDLKFYYGTIFNFETDTTVVLPNLASDIGMDWCTYRLEDYVKDFNPLEIIVLDSSKYLAKFQNGIDVLNIRNGVVVQSLYTLNDEDSPRYFKLYSSGLYLIKDYKQDTLTYLNKDGSVALFRDVDNLWYRCEKNVSLSDLLFEFLSEFDFTKLAIIKDYFNNSYPLLREFTRRFKIPYVGYLHYSPLDKKGEVVDTVKHCDFDVILSSSKLMMADIKSNKSIPILYVPPIFTRKRNDEKVGDRFIMLTSSFSGKRTAEMIEWFNRLGNDYRLDIYGLPTSMSNGNVFCKGYRSVEDIDWSLYKGYISHSDSETFSIALHEAISFGCFPIVFDCNYAHREWDVNRYQSFDSFKILVENCYPVKSKVLSGYDSFILSYSDFLSFIF